MLCSIKLHTLSVCTEGVILSTHIRASHWSGHLLQYFGQAFCLFSPWAETGRLRDVCNAILRASSPWFQGLRLRLGLALLCIAAACTFFLEVSAMMRAAFHRDVEGL